MFLTFSVDQDRIRSDSLINPFGKKAHLPQNQLTQTTNNKDIASTVHNKWITPWKPLETWLTTERCCWSRTHQKVSNYKIWLEQNILWVISGASQHKQDCRVLLDSRNRRGRCLTAKKQKKPHKVASYSSPRVIHVQTKLDHLYELNYYLYH